MITVGQIGVGYWGPNLLRNLNSNDGCNVKVVADLSKDRREFVEKSYPNVFVTEDVNNIFNDQDIDAVIISTPASTHYELAIRSLNSNKHILVEKPMATTSEEVKHIKELSSKKELVAMVGHTFLYNSAVRCVKSIIDSGEIGNVRYIYSQRLNLGRIRNDIDALWNLAPHDISIIQYLLDEIEPISVSRSGQSYVQDGIDDVVFLNLAYPNKVIANIHVSWLDPQKTRKMVIVGSKKMIIYDDIADNKVIVYDKGIDRMSILGENMDFDSYNNFNYREGKCYYPDFVWEEPLKKEINHFLKCINNSETCLTDCLHAEKVINILNKKYV